MRKHLRPLAALSDESRVRMLFALRHGELCVCQLIELLGLSPSTVSKHLSILRDAGLVESRKEARWVYYRLADQDDFPVIGKKAPPLFQTLEKSGRVRDDDKLMRRIMQMDMEQLCKRISQR